MTHEGADLVGSLLQLGAAHTSDVMVLLDGELRVRWINDTTSEALGFAPDEVVGVSALEFVHPEDIERVALTIARMIDPDITAPVRPAPVRLRRSSGDYAPFEMTGGSFTDTGLESGVLVIGRASLDSDLRDQLMELLTREAPSEEVFDLVPAFGQWRQPGFWHAVFVLDDDGRPAAYGDPELVGLGGLEDPSAPWHDVAASTGRWLGSVEDLREPARSRAKEAGLTFLSAERVWDAYHEVHAVAVWAQHAGSPGPTDAQVLSANPYVLDSTCRALALALSSRNQVLRLRAAANTDPLTGLANRAGFHAAWERWTPRLGAQPVALLSIDLDGFKAVNDTHGHSVGDELLVEVAARLRHLVRPDDVVARVGGDEFLVVAPGLADEDGNRVADRIVESIGQPFRIRDLELQIGASVGIVTLDDPSEVTAALERADHALYEAKAAGRGRWQRRRA